MQAAQSPDSESEQPGTSGRLQQATTSQELPGGRPKGLKVHFFARDRIDRSETCYISAASLASSKVLRRAKVSPVDGNSLREWNDWERKHGRALQLLTGVRMVSLLQGECLVPSTSSLLSSIPQDH